MTHLRGVNASKPADSPFTVPDPMATPRSDKPPSVPGAPRKRKSTAPRRQFVRGGGETLSAKTPKQPKSTGRPKRSSTPKRY